MDARSPKPPEAGAERKPSELSIPGFYELPTSLFVQKVDVNMAPLPPVAFYKIENGAPVLLRGENQPFSPLVLSQHDTVWIREADFAKIKGQAEGMLTNPKIGAGLPPQKRVELLRRSAIMVCDELFQNPTPENISRSSKIVGSFVYLLMKEPQSYLLLAKLSSHDPYTLQHSVGTAVNTVILAKKIGVKDEKELLEAGMAGLLHDIGKVKVRKEVINKEGPLDEDEWEEMRQHSTAGFEMIKDHPELSDRTKRAVLEHHEDNNGTGYPKGVKSKDTDVYSRIVAISDVFNALTTNRSYSKARTPFDAFQFMHEKLGHKIDQELFRSLVLIYGGKID